MSERGMSEREYVRGYVQGLMYCTHTQDILTLYCQWHLTIIKCYRVMIYISLQCYRLAGFSINCVTIIYTIVSYITSIYLKSITLRKLMMMMIMVMLCVEYFIFC